MTRPDHTNLARIGRISAIIPNYNHAMFLPAAIAALQAQTLPPDEIIVVDDGSTDDSVAVINNLAASDPRLRLITHPQNRGAIAAINTGINAAQGTYVLLGAADDVTFPHFVETLTRALATASDAAFAVGEITLTDQNGKIIGYRPPARPSHTVRYFTPDETQKLLQRIDNFIITGAALFSRQALIDIGFLREELGSFADGFATRQLALRHGFVFVPENLCEWRINPKSVSRQTATDPGNAIRMQQLMTKNFSSDPTFPADYAATFTRRWRFGVLRLALDTPTAASAIISEFAPGPTIVRGLFNSVAQAGRIGKLLALGWATLWYRPTSLTMIVLTNLARRRAKGS